MIPNMKKQYYTIRILGTDKQFECGRDETVLAAMFRSRVGPLSYGCCGGGCGICKMKVVSGEYETKKKMSREHITEAEENSGIVLLCCINPRSEICISKIDSKQ